MSQADALKISSEEELPLRVLSSNAGFYVGTFDDSHGPVSRDSVEYWTTRAIAQLAFDTNNWTKRESF